MPTFELSTQSAGAATPGRLRLVKPVTLAADALGAPRVPAVMVLSLRSFEPGVDRVRVSVLTSLFAQLREGERIEFVHHLCRSACAATATVSA